MKPLPGDQFTPLLHIQAPNVTYSGKRLVFSRV
jgi:hypothetical protein